MIALCDTGIVQGSQNEIIMLLIDDKMLCEYLLNIVSFKLHVTGSQTKRQKANSKGSYGGRYPWRRHPSMSRQVSRLSEESLRIFVFRYFF